MKKLLFFTIFLTMFFLFFAAHQVNAATEFISTIKESAGDYSSLYDWEAAINTDLTATSTRVFTASSTTGTVSDGATVTGSISSSTKATVKHNSATSSQILVENIRDILTGTSTFSNTTSTVTGTGTLFTSELANNDYIWLESAQTWQQITSIESNTSLTLTATSTINGTGQSAVKGKTAFQSGENLEVDGSNYVTISDVGDSPIAIAKIDGAWTSADTTAVTINGWTTSAANYIRIYTTTAARHAGKWDDTKYRLETINTWPIRLIEGYIRVDGLQVKNTYNASNIDGISLEGTGAGDKYISNNIVVGVPTGSSTYVAGICGHNMNSASYAYVWNNIVYGWNVGSNIASGIYSDTGYMYVYNNTVYNCKEGYRRSGGGTVIAKNNIAQNNTNGFYGVFNSASDYNISDISGDAPNATFSTNSIAVAFISTFTDDFHLSASDTSAKDAGTDLSSDGNLAFSDDIDGDTRSGTWDIGADEFVNAAPDTPSSLGPSSSTNGSWSASTTSTLNFSQSDDNVGDYLQYRVQIDDTSDFSSLVVDYTSASSTASSTPISTSFTVGQAEGSGSYAVGTSSQTLSDASYYWRIRSIDLVSATSSFAAANSGSMAFGVDTTAPSSVGAPSFGAITASSIVVNKPTSITENGSGLYQWQVRRDSSNELGFNSTSTTSITDSSLSENTQYTYDVQFKDNTSNTSSYGTSITKYTLAGTPTNFSGTESFYTMDLTVDTFPNSSVGSSGYYFSRSGTGFNSGWIAINSWQDTSLSCGISYTYTVKHRNGDGTQTNTASLTQATNTCGGGMPAFVYNAPALPVPSTENLFGGFGILINDGAETTNSRTVVLKFFAGDNTKRMAVSENPDFKYASQETYQEIKEWKLSKGAGTKIIYVKFFTEYGISSEVVSDEIILLGTKISFSTNQTANVNQSNQLIKTKIITLQKQLIILINQLLGLLRGQF